MVPSTREKHDDVEIQGAIRQGNAWSKPFRLAKVAPLPHWNPVLRLDADKTIHLYFKVGGVIDDWVTHVQESHDGARSWTQPRELVKNDRTGGRGPVKNKCITLADGTVLAPASREKGQWTAFDEIPRRSHLDGSPTNAGHRCHPANALGSRTRTRCSTSTLQPGSDLQKRFLRCRAKLDSNPTDFTSQQQQRNRLGQNLAGSPHPRWQPSQQQLGTQKHVTYVALTRQWRILVARHNSCTRRAAQAARRTKHRILLPGSHPTTRWLDRRFIHGKQAEHRFRHYRTLVRLKSPHAINLL